MTSLVRNYYENSRRYNVSIQFYINIYVCEGVLVFYKVAMPVLSEYRVTGGV